MSRNRIHRTARWIGHAGALIRDLPGLQVYILSGGDWSVAFIGKRYGLKTFRDLLSGQIESEEELGLIQFWKMNSCINSMLDGTADMVIVESGLLLSPERNEHCLFKVPSWINQVMRIDRPMKELLAGNRKEPVRRKIRKLKEAGFSSRITRDPVDFRNFYTSMYLPFVKNRHEGLAVVTSAEELWTLWIKKHNGVLVLVTRDGKDIAGMICSLVDDTCYSVEGGVLNADPELFRSGVWAYVNGACIEWGQNAGAKYFNFGSSRAWRSNQVFESKRRWGTQTTPKRRATPHCTFLAKTIKPQLKSFINDTGFICEYEDQLFGVRILDARCNLDELDGTTIGELQREAQRYGMDGMLAATPEPVKHRYIPAKPPIAETA